MNRLESDWERCSLFQQPARPETRNGKLRLKLVLFNEIEKAYWNVFTNKLVLALPRRSLELLDQTNFFFNDRERRADLKNSPFYSVGNYPAIIQALPRLSSALVARIYSFGNGWANHYRSADFGKSIISGPI